MPEPASFRFTVLFLIAWASSPLAALLVSFRSLGEITRIDTHTGAVLWRLGGLRNQFTFPAGDPPFVGQHGVRAAPDGFVVLDNLGEVTGTRAERYEIDDASRSARLTGWYHPAAATVAELGGAIQGLPDGHLLVAFGSGAAVRCRSTTARRGWCGRSRAARDMCTEHSGSGRCTTREKG